MNNKEPNTNASSQTRRNDTCSVVSTFHENDTEMSGPMMSLEDGHFNSDLKDDPEDLNSDKEGLIVTVCDDEHQFSRNSSSNNNSNGNSNHSMDQDHLCKSHIQGPVLSQNNSSQSPHTDKLLTCKVCGYSHKWPLIMSNHLRIFHKLQSPFDQYIVKLQDENNLPQASDNLVNPNPSQNHKCKLCDISFELVQDLTEHNEDLHTDLVWACNKCSFANKWQQLAISHLRSAHNCHPPYIEHLTRRTSETITSTLQKHLQATPSETSGSQSISVPTLGPSTSSFKEKPKKTVNHNNTIIIKNLTNSNTTPATTNSTTPTKTKNNTVNNASAIKKKSSNIGNEVKLKATKNATKDCYQKLEGDQYQCKTCEKTCGSAQGITEHYEAFHLGMNYRCRLCGFTDIWRSMLTKHLKQKHQLGKPYEQYLKRVKLETNRTGSGNGQPKARHRRRKSHLKAALQASKPILATKKPRKGRKPKDLKKIQ